VQLLLPQRARRLALEMVDHPFNLARVPGNHQVNVFRQDRTGPQHHAAATNRLGKTVADGAGLNAAEMDGRILERLLGCQSQGSVMGTGGDGTPGRDLGRGAEPEEFPGAHKIGPGTARIIGQPEPIRREDHVVPKDHEDLHRV